MESGKILYKFIDELCLIKLQGMIEYKLGPDFDAFLQKIAQNKEVDSFIVDLTETTYIDSTNLGLIAKLYEIAHGKQIDTPTLICGNETINEILRNVGFNKVFTIVDSFETLQVNMRELPVSELRQDRLASIMLSAHKTLSNLNGSNCEKFQEVINYLEHDVNIQK